MAIFIKNSVMDQATTVTKLDIEDDKDWMHQTDTACVWLVFHSQ